MGMANALSRSVMATMLLYDSLGRCGEPSQLGCWRLGLATSSPPQLGHGPASKFSAQD